MVRSAKRNWVFRRVLFALLLLAAMFSPAAIFGQACPLCYQSAAASSARFIQALKGGILVLLIPSVLIGAGVSLVTYRRRNANDDDELSAGE